MCNSTSTPWRRDSSRIASGKPGAVQTLIATTAPFEVHDSRNLARNRQEDRCVEVYASGSAFDGSDWAPLVTAVVCVTRQTSIRSAATGLRTRREETALYVSSVMLPAETFGSAIRNHWSIENKTHWVRDVTLAEDASRIGINPRVMARLRKHRQRAPDRRNRPRRQPVI